ncbi:hypothetical protein [Salinimicrobium soli]|uniref:hypothetical protein n=1 Tax=Salinimicrobium soli TaxID=1254399 RepID=UPI003AAE9E1E
MSIKKWFKKKKKVVFDDGTMDKTYSSEKKFSSELQAKQEFERSVQKLFHVNQWSDLPGITSKFVLFDKHGNEKDEPEPEFNDFIKILLPGPFPENWVMVTDIKKGDNFAEFTVSPSIDPTEEQDGERKIEHFFIDKATSTFRVELRGDTLTAWEIGKREGINDDEEAGDREILNSSLAIGGWAFAQKVQWKKLTDFLVHKIEIG